MNRAQQLSLFYAGAVSPSSDWFQRWRDGRHHWRHRSEGGFDSRRYEVPPLAEAGARRFAVQHHYLATYPASRLRYGLYARVGALVGVAVLSVPPRAAVLAGALLSLAPFQVMRTSRDPNGPVGVACRAF